MVKKPGKNKEYVVLTQKGCAACDALKKEVHNVKYLDLDYDPEAVRLADRFNVKAVPTVLQVDRATGKVCKLDDKLRPVKCLIDRKS